MSFERTSPSSSTQASPAPPTRALTADEIDAFRRKDFVVTRGRFTHAEVTAWQEEAERIWALPGLVDAQNVRVEKRNHLSGEPVLDRLDPVLDLSPQFSSLVRDPRIVEAVESVLGPGATVFRCKLIMKRPGTLGYDLHQDYPYWESLGIPADDMLTVSIPLDGASAESGAMELLPGNARRFPGRADEPRDLDPSGVDLALLEMPELAAGDLVLFHSLTPHRSAANTSNAPRRLLLPSFVGPRHGDLYERYNREFIERKLKAGGHYR